MYLYRIRGLKRFFLLVFFHKLLRIRLLQIGKSVPEPFSLLSCQKWTHSQLHLYYHFTKKSKDSADLMTIKGFFQGAFESVLVHFSQ